MYEIFLENYLQNKRLQKCDVNILYVQIWTRSKVAKGLPRLLYIKIFQLVKGRSILNNINQWFIYHKYHRWPKREVKNHI